MKLHRREIDLGNGQQGSLILVTMLILLVITVLGMSSVDSTGLEMQMANNSRLHQQTFEAAEYGLSWVENNLQQTGYFSLASITNDINGLAGEGNCGAVCFSDACENGYCFHGIYDPLDDWSDCRLGAPNPEPHADPDLWVDGSNMHQTLEIPNSGISVKYFVEFWCYTAKNPAIPITDVGNQSPLYRVTAFAVGEGGRSRVMLRSLVVNN